MNADWTIFIRSTDGPTLNQLPLVLAQKTFCSHKLDGARSWAEGFFGLRGICRGMKLSEWITLSLNAMGITTTNNRFSPVAV